MTASLSVCLILIIVFGIWEGPGQLCPATKFGLFRFKDQGAGLIQLLFSHCNTFSTYLDFSWGWSQHCQQMNPKVIEHLFFSSSLNMLSFAYIHLISSCVFRDQHSKSSEKNCGGDLLLLWLRLPASILPLAALSTLPEHTLPANTTSFKNWSCLFKKLQGWMSLLLGAVAD